MMGLVFLLIPDWIVQGIVFLMLMEMGFAMRMKLQDVQTLLLATTMPARQMTMGPAIIVLVPSSGGLTTTSNIAGYDVDVEVVQEHTDGELAGLTTYRIYLSTNAATDGVSAIVGDNEFALSLATTTSFYQRPSLVVRHLPTSVLQP